MTLYKPSLKAQGEGAIAGCCAVGYVLAFVGWACVLWAWDRVRHVVA